MKNVILAILAGGIAFFVVGGIVYEVILGGFYEANLGSATGVNRDVPVFWALALSQFALAALVAYVFHYADVTTAGNGLKVGALFGLLLGIAISFNLYSVTNWSNAIVAFAEPVVSAVRVALVGSLMGWILSRRRGSA